MENRYWKKKNVKIKSKYPIFFFNNQIMMASKKLLRIIKNVKIIYKNGQTEIFDTISIEENGVYTGYTTLKNANNDGFVFYRFIPKDHIEKIFRLSDSDDNLIIDFNKNKGGKK